MAPVLPYDEKDPRWPRRLLLDDRGAGVLHLPDRWSHVAWSDCAAVDRHEDGVWVVHGRDGGFVVVDPGGWPDPARVLRALEDSSPAALRRDVRGPGRPLDRDRPPTLPSHTPGRRVALRARETTGRRRVVLLASVAFIVVVMALLLVARLAR